MILNSEMFKTYYACPPGRNAKPITEFTTQEAKWWLSKEWGKVTPAGWGYQPYIDTVTWWRDASPEERKRARVLATLAGGSCESNRG